jgi:hypothetical protein
MDVLVLAQKLYVVLAPPKFHLQQGVPDVCEFLQASGLGIGSKSMPWQGHAQE